MKPVEVVSSTVLFCLAPQTHRSYVFKASTVPQYPYGAHHSSALEGRGNVHFYTLDDAIRRILAILYFYLPPAVNPQNRRSKQKTERNAEIRARHAAGERASNLAKEYSISDKRLYQILKRQPK
jgi:hypothetical protein